LAVGVFGPNVVSLPTVSVIIPARNDSDALRHAVATINAQTGAEILDIAIAVGPSTDDTEAEAHRLARTTPAIKVVTNPSGRTPAALNAAIGATTGGVVVRVDARSQLPPDYIQNALETMRETGAGNVGAIQVPVGFTPTERGIAAAMRHPLGTGGAQYRHGQQRVEVETAYLGVFRRDALEAVRATRDWVDTARQFGAPDDKLYSWWSYRAKDWNGADKGRRLDHVWITPDLREGLRSYAMIRDVRGWDKPSDHAPVMVTLEV